MKFLTKINLQLHTLLKFWYLLKLAQIEETTTQVQEITTNNEVSFPYFFWELLNFDFDFPLQVLTGCQKLLQCEFCIPKTELICQIFSYILRVTIICRGRC
jgi:hypothetical protein